MLLKKEFQLWRGVCPAMAGACLLLFALSCGTVPPTAPGSRLSGEQIYRRQCLQCHGENGEGVKGKYEEPLVGDWSIDRLAKVISKTMPDDKPGSCTGPDAQAVARYIHGAFYSAEAQARTRPPRWDLAHLTNRQFEESVADLFGAGSGLVPGEERGLQGAYYNARNFRADKRVFTRTDPQVAFHWGAGTPDNTRLGAEEFAVQWTGSLWIEETGEYEFILKSGNGARLWVNDTEKALIDGWVANAQGAEYHATIRLLGGRAYPLRLDWFKFKEKNASVELLWKAPHGLAQTIPRRHLLPQRALPTLVLTTPFPPDDSSAGYARGTAVSKQWDEAATQAALEVAQKAAAQLEVQLRGVSNAAERVARMREFCGQMVERAFRRPLTPEERQAYLEQPFAQPGPAENAVKRVVLRTLKSPYFLYPMPAAAPDDAARAARLALALWDSLPDAPLLQAAAAGRLRTREQLRAEAERLVRHPRAQAKLRGFFEHWLELERAENVTKDPGVFPDFNAGMAADLRASLQRFLDHVVWEGPGDYRQLLLADYLFLNDRLAGFYGLTRPPGGEDFVKVPGGDLRAGVLTHPYLLATFAYADSTSPIHRGVFLARHIAGRALKPPPNAILFKDQAFKPGLTMREKVTHLTSAADCMSCHSIINPLGFALENFDALGRHRTHELGRPVDAASDYLTLDGQTVRFASARDVARHAAENPHAQRQFVEQLFQHVAKQSARAFGRETAHELWQGFVQADCNVPGLLAAIAVTTAWHDPTTKTVAK
jgi:hypothetical protein